MKLFYKDQSPDFSKILAATSKGYGIQNPDKINGFAGAFLFTLLDVYLSERLEQLLEFSPEFASTLHGLFDRFKNEDYGDISINEESANSEQRYLCGCHTYMIARYETVAGKIIFQSFLDMSLLYFDEEDISAIVAAH